MVQVPPAPPQLSGEPVAVATSKLPLASVLTSAQLASPLLQMLAAFVPAVAAENARSPNHQTHPVVTTSPAPVKATAVVGFPTPSSSIVAYCCGVIANA